MTEKTMKEIQEKLEKQKEEGKQKKLSEPVQLPLFAQPDLGMNLPFYTQGKIEKEASFLPNSTRKKSVVLFRSETERVTIGKAGNKEFGVLKTRHRDLLYAVLYLWARNDWPKKAFKDGERDYGYISTTKYELLKLLYPNDYLPNSKDYEKLVGTLFELNSIPIEVYNLETKEEKSVYRIFFACNYDTANGVLPLEIFLNPDITDSYYLKESLKVIFFDVYRSFKTDIAKTLYTVINWHLGGKIKCYSVKVETLCKRHGLTEYKYNSIFRDKWKKALDELDDCLISSLQRIKVNLYENDDKELVFSAVKSDINTVKSLSGH